MSGSGADPVKRWFVGRGSCGPWVIGRGSWVVWVVGHWSLVMGHGSWVMGHGSWVMGRKQDEAFQTSELTSELRVVRVVAKSVLLAVGTTEQYVRLTWPVYQPPQTATMLTQKAAWAAERQPYTAVSVRGHRPDQHH